MAALSERQQEILSLTARGWNHIAVAEELAIAPQTVRHHLQAIRVKLGARNTTHAVAIALQHHLIKLEDTAC